MGKTMQGIWDERAEREEQEAVANRYGSKRPLAFSRQNLMILLIQRNGAYGGPGGCGS